MAPRTQDSPNPNLSTTTGKNTGSVRTNTIVYTTTTHMTTSAVFMAVLLWWVYVEP